VSVEGAAALDPALAEHVAQVARRELRVEDELGTHPVERTGRPIILLVEPTRSIHRVLVDCLAGSYDVASAFDAFEGLRQADTLRPDLIVADLAASTVESEAMVRALRDRVYGTEAPILLLSPGDDPQLELRLLASGAQEIVHKPFLLPEVRVRVDNLIENRRARSVLNELVDRHQEDLARLAEEVAHHQNELQVALEHVESARAVAESAGLIKTNFLRMMSHELRTPITAMQLHLHMLESAPGVAGSPRAASGVQRLWRSTTRLLRLVDTILEWARVDSGRARLSVETFELAAVIAEVSGELDVYAQRKQLEVAAPTVATTRALVSNDRRMTRTVLGNLIGRAIQVTQQGPVAIELTQRGSGYRVCIRDGGHPLTESERTAFFDPFGSPDDLRWRGGEGSGLGLHVVRDIARALGGDIRLGAPGDRGNVVIFELPDLPATARAAPRRDEEPRAP
jgi:signal transduction histidine kinase